MNLIFGAAKLPASVSLRPTPGKPGFDQERLLEPVAPLQSLSQPNFRYRSFSLQRWNMAGTTRHCSLE